MTEPTTHERPGVYSVYETSALVSGARGAKGVGLVAMCEQTTAELCKVHVINTLEEAVGLFGATEEITELIRILFLNGAAKVAAVPVKVESAYQKAFEDILNVDGISILMCDSEGLEIEQGLRDCVKTFSQARRECIGVVTGLAEEDTSNITVRAGVLNSERMVMVSPGVSKPDGTLLQCGRLVAAVAGAIARETDPAMPLGGAELRGLSGLSRQFSDKEMDALIVGGVTPVETVGGVISVVRGVTTRVMTANAPDNSWRELTTTLIIDEVIPGIRAALRRRFPRSKNTEQTRGAIRSQVVLELENYVARETITGYGDVLVKALPDKPTVCLVEISFSVAHGLNQIWLSAHITV